MRQRRALRNLPFFMVDKSPHCGKLIAMTALPQVSATETADLRDVHKRIALGGVFSYWRTFFAGPIIRIYPWMHSFWPRWF